MPQEKKNTGVKNPLRCQQINVGFFCFCFIFSWHENNVIGSLKVMSVVGNIFPLQEGCNSLTC